MRSFATLAKWLGLCALVAAGCASAQRGGGTDVSARGMYQIAEEHYANEDFPAAASMMRHSIVNLPETRDYDELRHKLILRMAHTQLRAFHATGEVAFLQDAKMMLDRYVFKHEALFGDGERARKDRGDCYELLYEIESRLDAIAAAPPDALVSEIEARVRAEPATAEPAADAPQLAAAPVDEPPAADAAPSEPEPEPEPAKASEPASESAASGGQLVEVIDGALHRRVRVPNAKRPDVNDPLARQKLRSAFADADGGLVLTAPSVELIHGPRPLVRMSGLARNTSGPASRFEATALAHRFVASARPSLRDCYDRAFARRPIGATEATVEVTIDRRGRVHKPRIVDGRVVDGIGDICVIQVAAAARVPSPPKSAVRVRVPLVFFYQGPVVMSERFGETMPATHVGMLPYSGPYDPVSSAPRGLPSIDRHSPRSSYGRGVGSQRITFFP